MPLSWNEIRNRAVEFTKEYENAQRENAETQSFYNDFFNIFGISRRRIASFEAPVKKLGEKRGRIDLLWKGTLLVEQKSQGRDLEKAYEQALDYFPGLKEEEIPKYILVCDFKSFELYDLENNKEVKFPLSDLHKNVDHFGFIAGYQKREFKDQDPVNIQASELMGDLHDMLKEVGYSGHQLELFLVRLLFCLFADDTGIFEKDILKYYVEENTKSDGSDLGIRLAHLFQILNTPNEQRLKNIDEDLNRFPYVNGRLFQEMIPIASFDGNMRKALLRACGFNWSYISPAIFGSLFQSVMDKDRRRGVGAHYTTEQNIMKIIKPLFLDDLYEELKKIKSNTPKLQEFHNRIAKLKFLDPACGCGNFLILAYRELRLLEIEVLKAIHAKDLHKYKGGAVELNIKSFCKIDVDAFYGIEIEEFPARIAEVAMWLVDHQMNIRLSEEFGQYYTRIPLQKSANIIHANALRIDWKDIIAPNELSYILGNPPFVGKQFRDDLQNSDMETVFCDIKGAGVLDYVTAWYLTAAKYIHKTKIKCAFVSTNSISQGEQVSILWNELFNKYRIKIHFAHRTFAWGSEARGKAAVHVIIIGFAAFDNNRKLLYDYETPKAEPQESPVSNINPYLVEGNDFVILKRSTPLCDVPEMLFGSKPVDEGNFFFTEQEKLDFIKKEPKSEKYFRLVLSAKEFLNNEIRWCLWLVAREPSEIRNCPLILDRIEKVKKFRQSSKKLPTKEAAARASEFAELRQPKENFLLIPLTSSENRSYVPFGFFTPDYIPINSCSILPGATLYHFGVLTSKMHMEWMRHICGRLKSDYRYSNTLVYNNFPWAKSPTQAQIKNIEAKAQAVLDARAKYPNSSLADLYDSLTMPADLLKAHRELDKSVDKTYRKDEFASERQRIEYLFELYQKLTAPLMPVTTKKRSR